MGFFGRLLGPERAEEVVFTFELKGYDVERNLANLKLLFPIPDIMPQDIVTGEFKLSINYFGQIVQKLQALRGLRQDGIIVKANIEEIKHGESILISLLDELRELRKL